MSSIERDRKLGPPYAFGTSCAGSIPGTYPCYQTRFVLDGQDLLCDDAGCNGLYRTRIDDGRRIEFLGPTQGWRVLDRDGRTLTYGATKRTVNGVNGEVFSWLLERVEDAHGNWITYDYSFALGNVGNPLISYIRYGASGEGQTRTIAFEYEARPDVTSDFSAGFEQVNSVRLQAIKLYAPASTRVGQYNLEYAESPDSGRSLLEEVHVVGADGSTELLRPYVFEYSASTHSFAPAVSFGISSDVLEYCSSQPANICRRLLEINGDGVLDYLLSSDWTIAFGDGSGFPSVAWSGSMRPYVEAPESLTGLAGVSGGWEDFNGDGFTDAIASETDATSGACAWEVRFGSTPHPNPFSNPAILVTGILPYQGTSKCWQEATTLVTSGPDAGLPDQSAVGLIDMTGDGLPDRVTSQAGQLKVQRNLGTTMAAPHVWGLWEYNQDPHGFCCLEAANPGTNQTLIDLNGDGLPDRVFTTGAPFYSVGERLRVAYNYGAGLWGHDNPNTQPVGEVVESEPVWRVPPEGEPLTTSPAVRASSSAGSTVDLIDINGDGFVDRVDRVGSQLVVNYGNGAGLISEAGAPWTDPIGSVQVLRALSASASNLVDFADVNGDGLLDRVDNLSAVYLNQGPHPDLLRVASTPLGGSIEFEYRSTAQLRLPTGAKNPQLPFPMLVVTRTQRHDGRGSPAIVDEYDYRDGLFDRSLRTFTGFGTVVHKAMLGAAIESTETTTYRTDAQCQERPLSRKLERSNPNGTLTLLVQEDSTYLTGSGSGGWSYCLPKRTDVKRYEGQSSPRVARTEVEYAANPVTSHYNAMSLVEYGDYNLITGDVGADKRTTLFYYATPEDPNTAFLMSKPSWVEVLDHQGSLSTRTRMGYDSNLAPSEAGAGSAVERGDPTSIERWLGEELRWIREEIRYDAYGNPDLRTVPGADDDDANGLLQKSITYDNTYRTFPVAISEGADLPQQQRLTTSIQYAGCVDGDPDSPGTPEFPGLGLPCAMINPQGTTTTLGYDQLGRNTRVLRSTGLVKKTTYEVAVGPGETGTRLTLDRASEPDLVFLMIRDGLGRPFREESPGNLATPAEAVVVVQRTFDGRGRLATETIPAFATPAGQSRQLFYDALGRQTAMIDFDGTTRIEWAYEPNAVHQRAYLGAPSLLAQHQRTESDGLGRTVTISDYVVQPNGSESSSYTTSVTYNASDRPLSVVDPAGSDPSLCSQFTDPSACGTQLHETSIGWDSLGRRRSVIDPDTGVWTYEYWDSGLLRRQNRGSPAQASVDLRYDDLGRISVQDVTPGGNGAEDTVFTYGSTAGPGFGRLSVVSSATTTHSYWYDGHGRLLDSRQATNGLEFDSSHSYDELDRLSTKFFPDGSQYRWIYDGLNVARIENTAASYRVPLRAAEYDALGRPERLELGNQVGSVNLPAAAMNFAYLGPGQRLSAFSATRHPSTGATGVLDVGVKFDGLGRLTEQSIPGAPPETRTFSYDGLSRLRQAVGPWGIGNTADTWNFEYDPLGNITSIQGDALERVWVYSDPDRPRFLTQFIEANIGVTGQFDAMEPTGSGNIATRARSFQGGTVTTETFVWNAQERLHQISGKPFLLYYDAFGRRVRQHIEEGTNTTEIIYVGDDFEYDTTKQQANLSFSVGGRRIASFASFGNYYTGGMPPWLRHWGWQFGPPLSAGLICLGLAGVAVLASRRRPVWLAGAGVGFLGGLLVLLPLSAEAGGGGGGGSLHGSHGEIDGVYYITDHLGSMRAVVNLFGGLLETRDYDALGRSIAHTGDLKLKHRFTGQPIFETDVASDGSTLSPLYNYGARAYDPKWGRFISPDTRVEGLHSQGLNRYSYVLNRPTSLVDPTGRDASSPSGGGEGGFCSRNQELCVIVTLGGALKSLSGGGHSKPSGRVRRQQYIDSARRVAAQVGLSDEELTSAPSQAQALPIASRILQMAEAVRARGDASVFRGRAAGLHLDGDIGPIPQGARDALAGIDVAAVTQMVNKGVLIELLRRMPQDGQVESATRAMSGIARGANIVSAASSIVQLSDAYAVADPVAFSTNLLTAGVGVAAVVTGGPVIGVTSTLVSIGQVTGLNAALVTEVLVPAEQLLGDALAGGVVPP